MYLHNLRGILADLYSDPNDARRLADDAGLSVSSINFHGPAENVWQDVLTQAVNEERIEDLLQTAIDEYPTSSKLLMAAWTYKADTEHIIAVSSGEYDMNGNGNGLLSSLSRRVDAHDSRLADVERRMALIEAQLSVSGVRATNLDHKQTQYIIWLLIALTVAMMLLIYMLANGGAIL